MKKNKQTDLQTLGGRLKSYESSYEGYIELVVDTLTYKKILQLNVEETPEKYRR